MRKILLITLTVLCAHNPAISQYSIQGNGVVLGDGCYQLTGEASGQVGSVWYEELIDLNMPFELQFKMNFGSLNGENGTNAGADGMMFVLQNESPTALGVLGQGMGYGNLSPSLGIEFDTYHNEGLGDLWPDHIGIHKNGNTDHNTANSLAGPVQADPNDVDIEDGEDHAITINWDPSDNQLSVYFDCEFRLSTTIDLVNDIFNGESEVWWGFTASTGGSYNFHSVCLYENANPSGDVEICPGFTTQLIAGGDINSDFSWQPIDYLSDPSIYNPVASPPSSQVYTVTYTDFCGEVQANTIEVTVEPIDVQIYSDNSTITCDNTAANLSAYTNYSNATISWEATEGGDFSSTNGFTATTEVEGVYMAFVVSGDGNCSAEDTFEVFLDTITYSSLPGIAGFLNCYSPSYELGGTSNGDDAEYSWNTTDGAFLGSPNSATPTVISAGTYMLEVTNPYNGCTSISSIEIQEDFTAPEISLGWGDGVISCITPAIQIIGTSIEPWGYNNIIEWTWDEGGINDPWALNPITPLPGLYYITVTFEENGCTTSSDDFVEIEQDEYAFIDISTLTMPNIITPNDDGVNDKLYPMFTDPEILSINPLNVLNEYNLSVRNRWGNIVYENNGNPTAWDGRANGNILNSGAYLLEISYKSTCGEVQTGLYRGVLEVVSD
jgi:gliding motility-associated-like protein